MPPPNKHVRRRALRVLQDEAHPLYVFCLTGEELLALAEISRISRDNSGKLSGYQRPEVKRHVQDIANYLNGDKVVFPPRSSSPYLRRCISSAAEVQKWTTG